MVDASMSLRLSDSRKVAVWYAFLAESNARKDYQRICGDRDQSFCQTVTRFCKRLIEGHDSGGWPNADAVSLGLTGLIDQLWQNILFEGDEFDREAAKRQCRAYLGSVFPWTIERLQAPAAVQPKARAAAPVEPAAEEGLKYTLPAWTYHSEEYHALEREHLFLPGWQIVCHVSELAKTGDYVTFEFFGARGVVVRGEDGTLRAFHNSCRHRAHAVVSGERGNCPKAMTCAYHGWSYHLDGRNRSVSAPTPFPSSIARSSGSRPSTSRCSWDSCTYVSAPRVPASPSACNPTWRSSSTTRLPGWCRSTICGCTTSTSTGRTWSRTMSRTITSRWGIRACRR